MKNALSVAQNVTEMLEPSGDTSLAGISQLSFRQLIENTADGMLVVDLDGTVLYANPAAAVIFGQPLDELLH
ncbi:PAS domain-containing protein, partial [Mesorhizobium sp. BR1-1-7]|uniref:PAS domain-containing protein n=1 Tax=Mesorhizobium sp. BR1-1-7 TaxID=2876647 RepID=UPI001CCED223